MPPRDGLLGATSTFALVIHDLTHLPFHPDGSLLLLLQLLLTLLGAYRSSSLLVSRRRHTQKKNWVGVVWIVCTLAE